MRLRYTEPAARELNAGISYFVEHAPSVVVDFADSIDRALTRLLDHPYSAQETEKRGVRRAYIRRYHYSIFYTVQGDDIVILHIRHAARRRPWRNSKGSNRPPEDTVLKKSLRYHAGYGMTSRDHAEHRPAPLPRLGSARRSLAALRRFRDGSPG